MSHHNERPARDELRAWMKSHGKTQADLGEMIGAYQTAVSQLLSGTTDAPSLDVALAIERVTGIRVARWARSIVKSKRARAA